MENMEKSAFVISYSMCACSGMIVGILIGWLIWH